MIRSVIWSPTVLYESSIHFTYSGCLRALFWINCHWVTVRLNPVIRLCGDFLLSCEPGQSLSCSALHLCVSWPSSDKVFLHVPGTNATNAENMRVALMCHIMNVSDLLRLVHLACCFGRAKIFYFDTLPSTMWNAGFGPFSAPARD
jgi:hypothetical protein